MYKSIGSHDITSQSNIELHLSNIALPGNHFTTSQICIDYTYNTPALFPSNHVTTSHFYINFTTLLNEHFQLIVLLPHNFILNCTYLT